MRGLLFSSAAESLCRKGLVSSHLFQLPTTPLKGNLTVWKLVIWPPYLLLVLWPLTPCCSLNINVRICRIASRFKLKESTFDKSRKKSADVCKMNRVRTQRLDPGLVLLDPGLVLLSLWLVLQLPDLVLQLPGLVLLNPALVLQVSEVVLRVLD